MVKCHSIIIEPWFDGSTPREKRSAPCFRWTVTYEKNGSFQAQGFEDTHKSARDTAEAYLREHGVDMDWVPAAKEEEPKPRWTPLLSQQSTGHITIYSEVDHGTSVKLSMPRSQDGAAETNAKDDAVEFARESERILVVDDDPGIRKVPAIILRNQGYEIVEAGNSKEAIDHLKTGQAFDLLFTDVVLPGGMNGVEIAKEAKRLQPNIKVLYTSGYIENAVVHYGKLNPGMTLVNKPYRKAELLEKVRAILDIDDN